MFIIKASGEREVWNPRKLEHSLERAKVDTETAHKVIEQIEKEMREDMRTRDIYTHAFDILKGYHTPFAARYSLRKAIMELGPSGFPFEQFIAKILEAKGYETRVGVMV